jgi:predicted Rossmann fold flavoprotein
MIWPFVVVGGGAAGIMAAIQAAQQGVRVLVVERNVRLGKKILVSGNGRCNLTNMNAGPDTYHGANPHFARSALAQVDVWQVLNFFQDLGLVWREEPEGRIFPVTNQATSVLELLEYRLAQLGVEVQTESRLVDCTPDGENWKLDFENRPSIQARKALITIGSNAYPQLGTTGDGYEILSRLGYKIMPTYSSLVPMHTSDTAIHQMAGIRMQVLGTALVDGRVVASRSGEILFTAYGVSGPVPLWLSGPLAAHLASNRTVRLQLNLFPGENPDQVEQLLTERWERDPARPLGFSFVGLLPRKVGPEIVKMVGATADTPVGSVSKKTRRELAALLTKLEMPLTQLGPLEQAEVSGGGIATDQIHQRTMESKLHPGLYLAGEIVDIHGDWGGYNFQWAWSSGWVAGTSV